MENPSLESNQSNISLFERNKFLISIIFIVIVCVPPVLLCRENIVDPYFCISLAAAEKTGIEGKISAIHFGDFSYDPNKQGHLGYESILTVLILLTNLPPKILAVLPIGGFLVPFSFFTFTRYIFKSKYIAAFFAIAIAYDPSISPNHYSIFAYTWADYLFFLFMMIIGKISNEGKDFAKITLISLIFLGTFSIYWTTPVLMIIYLMSFNAIILIEKSLNKNTYIKSGITLKTTLMFVTVYLFFSKVLYGQFLHSIKNESYGGPLDAISQLISWIYFSKELQIEQYSAKLDMPIYNSILMLRYIVILLPILLYLCVKIFRVFKSNRCDSLFDFYSYIMWPTMIAGMGQTIAYGLRGHLSLRYISLLFLPLTIISLDKLKMKMIKKIVFFLILSFVICGMAYITLNDYPGLNKITNIDKSSKFMFDKALNDTNVLMDINTFGSYLLDSIYHKSTLTPIFYNSATYGMFIGDFNILNGSLLEFNYVVMNIKMSLWPTSSSNWRTYEPLSKYFNYINENNQISKIYDDSYIWIFKTIVQK